MCAVTQTFFAFKIVSVASFKQSRQKIPTETMYTLVSV